MIKFKYLDLKRVNTILLSGIVLISICGCSSKNNNYSNNNTYNKILYSSSEEHNIKSSEKEKDTITIEESSNYKKEYSELSKYDSSIEYSVNDNSSENTNNDSEKHNSIQDVIEFLEKIDDKITEKGYQIKDELIKDYGIVYDFIFEDGTIKGYTFNELKDNIKAKTLNIYLKIDEKIENKYPQYKDTIREKYGNIKNKVKDKLSQYKEKFINYLKNEMGEEKYNSFIDTKDKYVEGFKEQTKNDFNELKKLGGKAKEKVKKWFKKNED